MADTDTIRIYSNDKQRIKEMADAKGVSVADVVQHLLHEPVYRCPECEDPFTASEVDGDTIRERSVLMTETKHFLKGERTVKDFECPCCEARVKPTDLDVTDAEVSAEELAVTGDEEDDITPAEEA